MLQLKQMKIVFSEPNNEFIKEAAQRLIEEGVCEPVLPDCDFVQSFEILRDGGADALIAGIDFSSRDVILAARDVLGVRDQLPGEKKTFSSLFIADLPDGRRFIISDCATFKNPNEEQLFDIISLVVDASRKLLDDDPRVAMLSFSTFGSGGKDASIDKIRAAIKITNERRPDIVIDGEMQLDTAVDERIGQKKAPQSAVAGRANVLIVPDINSGNILYKAIEQFAHAKLAGPILLGFNGLVSDLSRGSSVEDVVMTAKYLAKLA